MQLLFRSLCICVSILIQLVGAQWAQAQKATMFRGNPQLTGVYDAKAVYKLDMVKFTFKTGGPIRSTPAVMDGMLYFGSGDGNFYAIDSKTGKERWHFTTGGAVHSSPAVVNGVVYFTSRDGNLYALNQADGKLKFTFKMGKELGEQNYWDYYLSSPIIEEGNLYMGSGDGYMYALNVKTNKLVWKFNAASRIRATPALSGNHVVFGTMDGYVCSVSKTDGNLQWKFATDGVKIKFDDFGNDKTSIFCTPAVGDGVVAVGGRDGFFYAVDLETGKEKFRFNHNGSWVLSTAINDGKIFVGSGSSAFVQALDINTGAEQWRFKTKSAVFTSLTLAQGMMYFGDFAGNVYAIDSKTGAKKWCFPLANRVFATPVVADGMVYCSSDDGVLYALQGSGSADTTTIQAKKVVYWGPPKSDTAFTWFFNGVDEAIKNYFLFAGYTLVNDVGLAEFMKQQVASKGRSVVVFANNKIPYSVHAEESGNALIRQYINAGGKVVLLGMNPLAYKCDPLTDVIDTVDFMIPERILGIHYPPLQMVNGYYSSTATAEGLQWGSIDHWTGAGAINPAEASTVIAFNEFGMAGAWLKSYGGPKGTGLLQLAVPRFNVSSDLLQLRRIIEYGIEW